MCEDFPCCGHEIGDCGDTESQAARDARFYEAARRREQLEDDYGFDPEDWDY